MNIFFRYFIFSLLTHYAFFLNFIYLFFFTFYTFCARISLIPSAKVRQSNTCPVLRFVCLVCVFLHVFILCDVRITRITHTGTFACVFQRRGGEYWGLGIMWLKQLLFQKKIFKNFKKSKSEHHFL